MQFRTQKNMTIIGNANPMAKERVHPAEKRMKMPICSKMTEKRIISSIRKEELFSLLIKESLFDTSSEHIKIKQ